MLTIVTLLLQSSLPREQIAVLQKKLGIEILKEHLQTMLNFLQVHAVNSTTERHYITDMLFPSHEDG